jgi:hypothetical protein
MKLMMCAFLLTLTQLAYSQNYQHQDDNQTSINNSSLFWATGVGSNSTNARKSTSRESEYLCDGPSQRQSKWVEDFTSRTVSRRICSYCDEYKTVIIYTYHAKAKFSCIEL